MMREVVNANRNSCEIDATAKKMCLLKSLGVHTFDQLHSSLQETLKFIYLFSETQLSENDHGGW